MADPRGPPMRGRGVPPRGFRGPPRPFQSPPRDYDRFQPHYDQGPAVVMHQGVPVVMRQASPFAFEMAPPGMMPPMPPHGMLAHAPPHRGGGAGPLFHALPVHFIQPVGVPPPVVVPPSGLSPPPRGAARTSPNATPSKQPSPRDQLQAQLLGFKKNAAQPSPSAKASEPPKDQAAVHPREQLLQQRQTQHNNNNNNGATLHGAAQCPIVSQNGGMEKKTEAASTPSVGVAKEASPSPAQPLAPPSDPPVAARAPSPREQMLQQLPARPSEEQVRQVREADAKAQAPPPADPKPVVVASSDVLERLAMLEKALGNMQLLRENARGPPRTDGPHAMPPPPNARAPPPGLGVVGQPVPLHAAPPRAGPAAMAPGPPPGLSAALSPRPPGLPPPVAMVFIGTGISDTTGGQQHVISTTRPPDRWPQHQHVPQPQPVPHLAAGHGLAAWDPSDAAPLYQPPAHHTSVPINGPQPGPHQPPHAIPVHHQQHVHPEGLPVGPRPGLADFWDPSEAVGPAPRLHYYPAATAQPAKAPAPAPAPAVVELQGVQPVRVDFRRWEVAIEELNAKHRVYHQPANGNAPPKDPQPQADAKPAPGPQLAPRQPHKPLGPAPVAVPPPVPKGRWADLLKKDLPPPPQPQPPPPQPQPQPPQQPRPVQQSPGRGGKQADPDDNWSGWELPVVEDEGQWEEPKRKGKKAPAPTPPRPQPKGPTPARAAARASQPVPQPAKRQEDEREYVAPPQPCWGLNHKPFNRDNCFRVDPAPGSPLKKNGKNYSPPRRKDFEDDDSDDGSDFSGGVCIMASHESVGDDLLDRWHEMLPQVIRRNLPCPLSVTGLRSLQSQGLLDEDDVEALEELQCKGKTRGFPTFDSMYAHASSQGDTFHRAMATYLKTHHNAKDVARGLQGGAVHDAAPPSPLNGPSAAPGVAVSRCDLDAVYRALPKTCPFRNMTTPLLLELQGLHSTWDCKEKIMQQLRALLPDVDEPDRRGPDACLIVGIYPKYGNGRFHKKAALELRGNNRARALASLLANHVKVKVLHSVQEERYIITAYGRLAKKLDLV